MCLNPEDAQTARLFTVEGAFQTLSAGSGGGMQRHGIVMELDKENDMDDEGADCAGFKARESGMTRGVGYEAENAPCLSAGCHDESVAYGMNPQGGMNPFHEECGETLAVQHGGGVAQCGVDGMRYVVRRLTPTECERLMGLPDGWTLPAFDPSDITDELVAEFARVHDEYGRIMADYEGRPPPKPKGAAQVRRWLERISDPAQCPDAPRYKGCGNGWATNQPRWIMLRVLWREGIDPWRPPRPTHSAERDGMMAK